MNVTHFITVIIYSSIDPWNLERVRYGSQMALICHKGHDVRDDETGVKVSSGANDFYFLLTETLRILSVLFSRSDK
jgi:hypothetical protein